MSFVTSGERKSLPYEHSYKSLYVLHFSQPLEIPNNKGNATSINTNNTSLMTQAGQASNQEY